MDLQAILNKLDAQNFSNLPPEGKGRTAALGIAAVNHPIDAMSHFLNYLDENVKAGTNPYTSDQDKLASALNLAGLMQTGSIQSPRLPSRDEISKNVGKYLQSAKVDPDLIKKLIRINEDVTKNDKPGKIVSDNEGNVLFSSNDNASHIFRQWLASDDFARKNATHPELNMSSQDLKNNTIVGLLHDIGKTRTPEDVINRAGACPPQGKTMADLHPDNYPDGELKDLLQAVYDRNGTDEFKGLSDEDFKVMKNHVNTWREQAQYYGVPEDLTKIASMHHLYYKPNPAKDYPKELATVSGKDIPLPARIQSLFDPADASMSPRYGGKSPSSFEEFINKLETMKNWKTGEIESMVGNQFDPDLYKLATERGHMKNFYDNIANKTGYQLSDLINSQRQNLFGQHLSDMIKASDLNRLGIALGTQSKD